MSIHPYIAIIERIVRNGPKSSKRAQQSNAAAEIAKAEAHDKATSTMLLHNAFRNLSKEIR